MARDEFADSVLPTVVSAFLGAIVVIVLICRVGIRARAVKEVMEESQQQSQRLGEERRSGGVEAPPNPRPSAPAFVPPSAPALPPMPSVPAAPPAPLSPPAAPILIPGLRETKPEGGAFARTDYREYRRDGAILVGFDVGFSKVFNTDIIAYLRPIWLTGSGEKYGTAYGRTQGPVTTIKAQNGYAVGGIKIAGGGALEGFCLTFMRIGTKSLDATDSYTSDWYGEQTRRPRPEAMRSGDGGFVVGFYGKRFDDKGGRNYDDGGAIGTIGLALWVKE